MTAGRPNGVLDTLARDIAASHDRPEPSGHRRRVYLELVRGLTTVRGIALVGMRIANWLHPRSAAAASAVKQLTHAISGADIAPSARIGPGFRLLHPTGVVIAHGTLLGTNCTVHAGVVLGGSPTGSPVVGDRVNIGPGACLLGPVTIGPGSRVGANSVVTRSFPEPSQVLVGAPARVTRSNEQTTPGEASRSDA